MRLAPSISLRRGIGQRATCVALVVAYLITAVGMPLPIAGLRESSNEKYPCAGGSCGCDSADKCWRSCCCHTLVERIAWARRHGVEPPWFVLAQARAAGLDVSWLADNSNASGERIDCCAELPHSTMKVACCNRAKSTCDTSSRARQCCSQPTHDPPPTADVNHIVAWRALACRGHSMNWLAAAPILIVPPARQIDLLPLAGRVAPIPSIVLCGVAEAPALPPPEAA